MPGGITIFFRRNVTPTPCCLSLIDLCELEKKIDVPPFDGQLLSLLSPREKEIFAGFTFAKRRREWLGGRLVAKFSFLALLNHFLCDSRIDDISILPRESGAPEICSPHFHGKDIPALSISHSGDFAVAMTAKAESCGIDIQKISDKTVRVADRFCNSQELSLLQENAPRLNLTERLTMLWSSKEALKKAILNDQPVIFKGVALRSMDVDRHFTLHLELPGAPDRPQKVAVVMLDNYMLAYTLTGAIHA